MEFLNVVFGNSKEALRWWKDLLPQLLKNFFSVSWYPSTSSGGPSDWRVEVFSFTGNGRQVLFDKIGDLHSVLLFFRSILIFF